MAYNAVPPLDARTSTRVFAIAELFEKILSEIESPQQLMRLASINKVSRALIMGESSNKLKWRTFMGAAKDETERWLVKIPDWGMHFPTLTNVLVVNDGYEITTEQRKTHILQRPVILNPLLVTDKFYTKIDIQDRVKAITDVVTFKRPLWEYILGIGGNWPLDDARWSCGDAMLCQPPTKAVLMDWTKPSAPNTYGSSGARVIRNENGVTLRQVLLESMDLEKHSLEITDVRIPHAFFVTAVEWDRVSRQEPPPRKPKLRKARLAKPPMPIYPWQCAVVYQN